MDTQTLREHLHQYIERADDAHLDAIFQIAEKDKSVNDSQYPWLTDEVLQMLEERRAEYLNGKGTSYTLEEFKERLQKRKDGNV